jgi:hypothetical protein
MDECSIIEFHRFGGTFKFFYHPIHKCFEGRILTHFEGGGLKGILFKAQFLSTCFIPNFSHFCEIKQLKTKTPVV